MPKFSNTSKNKLASCHPDLQRLCEEAIKDMDFTVLCGHRNEKDQNEAFDKGASKLKWPCSKHNTIPSKAVDLAPYPVDWNDLQRFKDLAECMKSHARTLGIKIQAGADWKMKDFPHYELI